MPTRRNSSDRTVVRNKPGSLLSMPRFRQGSTSASRHTHQRRSSPKKREIGTGVFVSSRTLSTCAPSFCSSNSSLVSDEASTSTTSTAQWSTSGSRDHHRDAPLIVNNPDDGRSVLRRSHKKTPLSNDNNNNNNDNNNDDDDTLGQLLARAQNLPGTWYYSSNHVLVNQERAQRAVAPLLRMRELDTLARLHAERMAHCRQVFHVNLDDLRRALASKTIRRLGSNVSRGESVRHVHENMMNRLSERNNIIDRRLTHMGMGTALGKDGTLYLCQIFRG